jgi:hypothetical protein
MSSVQELVVSAIQRKLVVTAIYQGYERIMCPHVIGHKKGVLNALFFNLQAEASRDCSLVDSGDAFMWTT